MTINTTSSQVMSIAIQMPLVEVMDSLGGAYQHIDLVRDLGNFAVDDTQGQRNSYSMAKNFVMYILYTESVTVFSFCTVLGLGTVIYFINIF